jgi:hypothetical protein
MKLQRKLWNVSTRLRTAPFLPRITPLSTALFQIVTQLNFVDWNFESVCHFLWGCCKSHPSHPRLPYRNDIYAIVIISYVWKHLPHAEVYVPSNRDGLPFSVPLMSRNLLLCARVHTDSPVGWFCSHRYTFIASLTATVCGSRVGCTRSGWTALQLSLPCFWSQLIIIRVHSVKKKWSASIFLSHKPEIA